MVLHILSFPSLYCWDDEHYVSYMAKYMAMEYSPCIYSFFSTSEVAIAESMEWDAALNKPISANKSLHWDIENIFSLGNHQPLTTPAFHCLVNFTNLTVSSLANPLQPMSSSSQLSPLPRSPPPPKMISL